MICGNTSCSISRGRAVDEKERLRWDLGTTSDVRSSQPEDSSFRIYEMPTSCADGFGRSKNVHGGWMRLTRDHSLFSPHFLLPLFLGVETSANSGQNAGHEYIFLVSGPAHTEQTDVHPACPAF